MFAPVLVGPEYLQHRCHPRCSSTRSTTLVRCLINSRQSTPPASAVPKLHSKPTTTDLQRASEPLKELTRAIMASENPSDLLELIKANHRSANARHLSATLLRLGKLVGWRNPAGIAELHTDPVFCWIVDTLAHREEEQPWATISVANVLAACATFWPDGAQPNEALLARATAELARPERVFTVNNVTAILDGLVKLGRADLARPFVHRLEQAFAGPETEAHGEEDDPSRLQRLADIRLSSYTDRGLGLLAWGLTSLECSADTAGAVLDAVCAKGPWNLSVYCLSHVVRLVALRGSQQAARRAVEVVARLVVKLQLREEYDASHVRDLVQLVLAYAKAMQKAAAGRYSEEEAAMPRFNSASDRDTAVLGLMRGDNGVRRALFKILDAIAPWSPRLGEIQVCSVLQALSLIKITRHKILPRLATRAGGLTPTASARSVSLFLFYLSRLQWDIPEMVDAGASRMLDILRSSSGSLKSYGLQLTLFSFAVMDCYRRPAVQALLPELLGELDAHLPSMPPNYLPVLAWSLMLAKGRPGEEAPATGAILEALRKCRGAMVRVSSEITGAYLPMVHHIDLAIRVECPDLGMDLPADSSSFLSALYASGRLRGMASAEWDAQGDSLDGEGAPGKRLVSQRQVCAAARKLSPGWQFELWDPSLGYSLDVALPSARLAIEVDGPSHFSANTLRPLGHTVLKRRLLEQMGWQVVSVPLFSWDLEWGEGRRVKELRGRLEEAGVDIEALREMERSREEAAARLEAESSSSIAVENTRQQQQQQQDASASGESFEASASVCSLDAEEVEQRAQRLDFIQVRQKKLSMAQLVRKKAARSATQSKAPLPEAE